MFNLSATSGIYILSLHDALPICTSTGELRIFEVAQARKPRELTPDVLKDTGSRPDGFQEIGAGITSVAFHPKDPNIVDRKSTRLNSSHVEISYAVFCLKKKNIST